MAVALVGAAIVAMAGGRHDGLAAGADAVIDGPPAAAPAQAPAPDPAQATTDGVEMELIEEQYAFGPDESLRLVYRLHGDLDTLGLTSTPTAPETTIADSTVPDTTVPRPP